MVTQVTVNFWADVSIQVPIPRETFISCKPTLDSKSHANPKELQSERTKVRELIRDKILDRARIPQRHRMNLRNSEQREQVQLIQDKDTEEYLTYRKLLQDPKNRDV
jgi:hypothetical protein